MYISKYKLLNPYNVTFMYLNCVLNTNPPGKGSSHHSSERLLTANEDLQKAITDHMQRTTDHGGVYPQLISNTTLTPKT